MIMSESNVVSGGTFDAHRAVAEMVRECERVSRLVKGHVHEMTDEEHEEVRLALEAALQEIERYHEESACIEREG